MKINIFSSFYINFLFIQQLNKYCTPDDCRVVSGRIRRTPRCLHPAEKRTFDGLAYRSKPLLQNRSLFQTICSGCLWARDNRCLLSRVQRLAGPAGGQEFFVSVGASNRNKTLWPPYPLFSPPSRAIQFTCFCCSWLG